MANLYHCETGCNIATFFSEKIPEWLRLGGTSETPRPNSPLRAQLLISSYPGYQIVRLWICLRMMESNFCQCSATVTVRQTQTNPQPKIFFAPIVICPFIGYLWKQKTFQLQLLYSSPAGIHTQGGDSPSSSLLQNKESQLSQPLLLCHMIQLLYYFCAPLLDGFPICSCLSYTSQQCWAEWKDHIPWSVCSTLPNSAKDAADLLCHKNTLLTDDRGLELHLPLLPTECQC